MTTYTVAELARTISRAINRALPDEIWVQGEIQNLSRANSGHVYFTLIDPDSGDSAPAMLPVTLFEADKVAVNRILTRSGAVRMTDGVAVRIRGQVSHYAARGTVQLRMTWIDTDYTLGKLAAERERLIRSLDERGLLDKNRALPMPLVPLRVGLITAAGSAAAADFTDELARSGFAWVVREFAARVQGVDAVKDVVNGLATLGQSDTDVIAIVRGGGAKTDLAAFDSEEIALAIAACSVPVITGIGHEIDVSVADLVARSLKTPTACAASLVARVTAFSEQLDGLAAGIVRATSGRLSRAQHDVDYLAERLVRSANTATERAGRGLAEIERITSHAGRQSLRRERVRVVGLAGRVVRAGSSHLDVASRSLDTTAALLDSAAARSVSRAEGRLDELEHRLGLLDPRRLLARGWSITRTEGGDLVVDSDAVAPGARLSTTVAAGHITSVVTEENEDG